MQGLLRLAGWGVAATAALLFVVIAANSSGGRERLSVAFAAVNGTRAAEAAKAEAAQAAQLARLAATEADTRRLIEIVRSLAGDRERLLTRVAMLERKPGRRHRLDQATGGGSRRPLPHSRHRRPPNRRRRLRPRHRRRLLQPSRALGLRPRRNRRTGWQVLPPARQRPRIGSDPAATGGRRRHRRREQFRWTAHAVEYNHHHPLRPVRRPASDRDRAREQQVARRRARGSSPARSPIVESASRICTTLAAAKRYCRLVTVRGPAAGAARSEPPHAGRRSPRPARRCARRPDPERDCPAAAGGHSRRDAGDLLSDRAANQLAVDRRLPGDRRGTLPALSRHRIRAGVARLPGRPAKLAVHDIPRPSSFSTITAYSDGSRWPRPCSIWFDRRSS